MKRTRLLLVSLALPMAMAVACSSGDDSGAPAGTPDATSETPATVTSAATATATAAPGEPNIGAQITMDDVTASLPVTSDGRRWLPVAGAGEQVLLEAERDVPPVPGEPVPQGRARYDQQFWLWNPATSERRLAWSNDSDRPESVYAIDKDWALSYLTHLKPGNRWTIRLHNLQSGEQRDIASVHPTALGQDSISPPVMDGGRVVYVHKVPGAAGALVERVELYDIARDSTTTLSETPARPYGAWSPQMSTAGGRLGWTIASEGGAITALHVLDAASGNSAVIPSGADQWWTEIAAGDRVLGVAPGESGTWTTTNRYFVRDAAGGLVTTYLAAAVGIQPARGDHVSWIAGGTPSDLRGYYDIPANTLHILAPNVRAGGQVGGVVDGWFFWLEPGPNAEQSFATGTLHLVRI